MNETEKDIIALSTFEQIESEAASWLTVLGREEVTELERAKLRAWLRQSERHQRAFDHLAKLCGELEILKELADIAESMSATTIEETQIWRRRDFMAMAASVGTVMIGSGAYYWAQNRSVSQQGNFITSIGEQRKVELRDETLLQLNTDSEVEVDFSRNMRAIRLIRGEAHFDVSKDKNRPFLVYAAGRVVRAVGTAFAVRLKPNDDVEVTVEEGSVALESLVMANPSMQTPGKPAQTESIAELKAGQNAVFNQQIERLTQMEPNELTLKLAWRQGLLAYAGDPLEAVVADISRYTDITIEISDPSLREMPIGGYFRVGEIDALFDSLELTFGLTVERISDRHVKLSGAS